MPSVHKHTPPLADCLSRRIFATPDGNPNTDVKPVLQCVQVKPIPAQQGQQERFRVVFSDISNFVQSMLATRSSSLPVDLETTPC